MSTTVEPSQLVDEQTTQPRRRLRRGRKAKAGAPYCEAHVRMAYQPAQSRRDRDRDLVRKRLNFG